jgi:hypothetical protein
MHRRLQTRRMTPVNVLQAEILVTRCYRLHSSSPQIKFLLFIRTSSSVFSKGQMCRIDGNDEAGGGTRCGARPDRWTSGTLKREQASENEQQKEQGRRPGQSKHHKVAISSLIRYDHVDQRGGRPGEHLDEGSVIFLPELRALLHRSRDASPGNNARLGLRL